MVQIITNSNWWGWVWLYKYKGSVDYYEDLPSSWMKIWDVYNVVNEHTTAPVFPAWTNVAWTWTEWDALWWSIDLSDYQKKLVEWDWIDIDWDTNEISVESAVINWAAAWATAVQPWDDISDLNNDAWYITWIDSSDVTTALWYTPYDSANPSGYITSSAVKNGTLTIQKNGTNVQTFTANQSSNATANISVPTDTSDLTNNAWFITSSAVKDWTLTIQKNWSTIDTFSANSASNVSVNITVPTAVTDLSDASNYQTVWNLVTDLTNPDDTHYPSAKAVSDALSWAWAWDMLKSVYDPNNIAANAFDYDNFINTPTIPSVIDDLTSLSTTDALSANQWKVLKDAIDNLSWLWKFLSLWNSATWQPISFPLATPYTYTTWDWFMVETLWATNYKPTWSSYTGTASTTVESWTVKQWDVYIYDGTVWLLQVNNEPQVSFSEIAWNATDNASLSTALNAKQNTLTAWENIKISSNVISANNVFIITEDDVTVSTDATKWVAPYNTSYGYTNIDISASAGIEWREWAIYTFVVNSTMVVASTYRNVRVKIWTWAYIPVMWTTSALAWHSYFTKANTRQYQYSTKYEAGWALHLFTDSNTTYSSMTSAEITAWTWTTARTITPANLKTAIQTWDGNVVDDTAYAASWDGVTWIAPSKNAVYDKIESIVGSIPTVNNATLTIQKNWTTVNTFTANASSNVTANITVPTDTWDLTNGAWFVTNQVSDTAYWAWWDWDTTTAPSKNAVYDKISAMDTTIAWKQAALSTQTAYTSKWTSTKVPTITTNTLWQVTGITETSIAFPVTSVNWQTWAVSLTIPTISTITVTLTSAWWSSSTQTVSATGVTASNTVIVSPAPSSIGDYADNGVYCYSQASGTLTFKCSSTPSSNISVNVVILS